MSKQFEFLKNKISGRWVIISPGRSDRPNVDGGTEPRCPFCPGHEEMTPPETYRTGDGKTNGPGWDMRVVPNKYSFAPAHEVIIDTPEHGVSFFSYSQERISDLFKVYRQRYNHWKDKGQVVIFYNHGVEAAASLPHSHTQLAVVPKDVQTEVTRAITPENIVHESKYFTVFIPNASEWPYEVWFLPKHKGSLFGDITNQEIDDLSHLLKTVLKKMVKTMGGEFPFNFHIYHGGNWYLRFFPRTRRIGGFEIATGIYVHSKPPKEAADELSF